MQAEGKRGTLWRQGSVIKADASLSLGLSDSESATDCFPIVISHDCDVVEDDLVIEPSVEVIVGRLIKTADPNLTYSKSPNRLHLEVLVSGEPKFIELQAGKKRSISKSDLASFDPDENVVLSSKAKESLQAWLAARYRRASFPDALNAHLRLLRETLQNIGKQNPQAIIGFYIYYEPDREITDDSEPYEIWITVVFDHKQDGSEDMAKAAVERIRKRMESKFRTDSGWRGIDLVECEAASDEEFSLYNAMTFKNYPLEYLSLRPTEASSKRTTSG
jgi:hypothetical protein